MGPLKYGLGGDTFTRNDKRMHRRTDFGTKSIYTFKNMEGLCYSEKLGRTKFRHLHYELRKSSFSWALATIPLSSSNILERTVKPVWSGHSKIDQTKILKTNGRMKVESTGQPRYLKVQGNGGNTSRYPKFDIAKMWRHQNTVYMLNFVEPDFLRYTFAVQTYM